MEINEILEKEPRLKDVLAEAISIKNLPYWEKNKYWYKRLKSRMSSLVGFDSKNYELQSCEVYDKVYFLCLELMEL